MRINEIDIQSEQFERIFSQWEEDITHFIPDFDIDDAFFSKAYLITIDDKPAGLFVYQEKGDEIHINLDYLAEVHRNKGIGKQIFENLKERFKSEGFNLIVALSYNPDHENYLRHIGFNPSEKFQARFEIDLK